MAEDTHIRVRLPLTGWIAVLGAMATAIGSLAVAQSQLSEQGRRMETIEARQERLSAEYAAVRLLLERIDERTAEIKRRQEQAGR